MTRDDIRAEFARFIEFPPGSDRKYVSTASALLFAEHVAKMTREQVSACEHDWSFDAESPDGSEADFSCHKCGATHTAKKQEGA